MTPLQTVESIYAAFGRKDIEHIVGLVAPDATWRQTETVPWGGVHKGPDGARRFFSRLAETIETSTFEIEENIVVGDRVFTRGTHGGKALRTGKPAVSKFLFVWQIKDGKVAAYEGHIDSAAYDRALH